MLELSMRWKEKKKEEMHVRYSFDILFHLNSNYYFFLPFLSILNSYQLI